MKHLALIASSASAASVARRRGGSEAGRHLSRNISEGATKIADEQDELSADVQQLTIEQTVPKVIELLNEVENIMDEATDQLAEPTPAETRSPPRPRSSRKSTPPPRRSKDSRAAASPAAP